ncbi:MAG TPA: EFR1 family ferrodoxin [Candidatus Rifleibacterium sp.]|nr:EFR1 family ferrodoxin [Candidatus Rifleibacterium sp.]
MSTTVLYFSGTGNSLTVAQSLARELADARTISLAELRGLTEDNPFKIDSETVVFVFPVYASGIPVIVRESLKRISFSGVPYVCAIATCGSSPGAAVGIFASELQKSLSVKLSAGWALVMPGNYTPLYGAYSDQVNNRMLASASERLRQLIPLIASRTVAPLETTSLPVAWLFWFIWKGFAGWVGRSDRHFRALSACTGCGLCEQVCPVENIRLSSAGRPVWQHHCEQCMACLQFCPVEAIQFCWWTKGRRRYRHPQITAAMITAQKKSAG